MLRSIELFPEDGLPVGRTPFILSVLTLRSSHPLGGFPPSPSPLLLAASSCSAQVLPWQISLHPRFYAPMAATTTSMGLPSAPPSFLFCPSYTLPPPSFFVVPRGWMELIQRARFSPLLYFGVLAFGLMGFARIRMRCVCVCVCACALCDFWPWWEFCEGLVALQCMRYTYFFDKKEFLPSGLNWFFFFFLEILNLRIGLDWRLKFVIMYYSFNILVPGKWDLRFWSWELVFFKVAKFIF